MMRLFSPVAEFLVSTGMLEFSEWELICVAPSFLSFIEGGHTGTRRTLNLLRNRDFRQLFFADTISQFGSQVSQLALPLVAILALHASTIDVGLLLAAQNAGFVVSLPAGAWVDRMRCRPVMITSDIACAIALGSIPAAWWAGTLTIFQLYLCSLIAGVGTVFFNVAYQSYLPRLLARDQLIEGNAQLEVVRNISLVSGPTAAGGIISAVGAPFSVAVDAASFICSALFVTRIHHREAKADRPKSRLSREIAEGVQLVLGNRSLRGIAISSGTYNLFSSVVLTMLLVLFARDLRMSPAFIGLVFSVTAIGALAGALATRTITHTIGYGPTIWLSLAVTTPFGLLLPLATRGWSLWMAIAGYAIIWFGTTVYNIAQVSFRQALTPVPLLGRMNASIRFLAWGTMLLGNLMGGILGQIIGVRAAIWFGSIGLVTCFLPALFSPLRTTRELPAMIPDVDTA
jgi:Na+/melibiose symporter-like transporter